MYHYRSSHEKFLCDSVKALLKTPGTITRAIQVIQIILEKSRVGVVRQDHEIDQQLFISL